MAGESTYETIFQHIDAPPALPEKTRKHKPVRPVRLSGRYTGQLRAFWTFICGFRTCYQQCGSIKCNRQHVIVNIGNTAWSRCDCPTRHQRFALPADSAKADGAGRSQPERRHQRGRQWRVDREGRHLADYDALRRKIADWILLLAE